MIVVGYDGSDGAHRAWRWARDAAALRGDVPVRVIYASGGGDLLPELHDEVEVRLEQPVDALVAASRDATLLVVGHGGHGELHDAVVGSTSLLTAMHAHCPVVVVRPASTEPSHPDTAHRIVLGVDSSDYTAPALEFAFQEAERTGREIVAVHGWMGDITAGAMGMPYVYDPTDRQSHAERLLEETLAPWMAKHPETPVRQVVVQMPPAAAMIEHSHGAHMVVVGCRGLGGLAGVLLGSVSHALIHHSGCPVVVAGRPRMEGEGA